MTTIEDVDPKKETFMPFWIRVYNVVLGVILFGGTVYVLLYPEITLVTIIIFSILLLLMGLSRLINGLFDKGKRTLIRITKVTVGFILTALAILTYFAQDLFGEPFVIMFLSIALLINGITRLVVVSARKRLPNMIKVLMLVLGFMMIILSGFVLGIFIAGEVGVDPYFLEDSILVGILAITVQLSGIGRLTSGISGYRLTTRKTEAEYQIEREKKKEEKKQEKLEEELRKAKKEARD